MRMEFPFTKPPLIRASRPGIPDFTLCNSTPFSTMLIFLFHFLLKIVILFSSVFLLFLFFPNALDLAPFALQHHGIREDGDASLPNLHRADLGLVPCAAHLVDFQCPKAQPFWLALVVEQYYRIRHEAHGC